MCGIAGLMVVVAVVGTATIANEPAANAGVHLSSLQMHEGHRHFVPTACAGTCRGARPRTSTSAASTTTTTTWTQTDSAGSVPAPVTTPPTTSSSGSTPSPASSSDPSGEAMPGQIPGWTQTFADDFTSPSTLSNYQVEQLGSGTRRLGFLRCLEPRGSNRRNARHPGVQGPRRGRLARLHR